MKIPFISKKSFKRRAGKCHICDEPRYHLFDTHRISHGGEYSNVNCVCLCANCHRDHHCGIITIKGWCNSSCGKVLHYIDKKGEECFK